ncbi:hypothetical protein TNCV_3230871 [Trichonephila clavipes]|nr:hypothetical protein TNCV_3230871 [Trichonephila clavipes]
MSRLKRPPVAKTVESIPGLKGEIKLKTQQGAFLPLVQRLYVLEIQANEREYFVVEEVAGEEESNSEKSANVPRAPDDAVMKKHIPSEVGG